MLKHTKIELELLVDYEKYLLFEKGKRGGISVFIKKYFVANHKYIPETCDSNKFITYLDANNLYRWAMSKCMAYADFTWRDPNKNFNILNIADDSPIGYILDVDVEYPRHLHDLHSNLPFFPINECVRNIKQSKLLTTLENKEKYVCHYVNLKQAIKHGLNILKIHRILQFSQSPWLKKYIDQNTEKRQHAENNFEKDFFKLFCVWKMNGKRKKKNRY